MPVIILTVLLLVLIVRSSRWLAARRRDYVTGISYPETHDDELPADYGMTPERPWERRPRPRARLARI